MSNIIQNVVRKNNCNIDLSGLHIGDFVRMISSGNVTAMQNFMMFAISSAAIIGTVILVEKLIKVSKERA